MREKVLGLPVDILTKEQALKNIEDWIKIPNGRLRQVVTAYSEFYVNGQRDKEFGNIMRSADMVTADGRSVLAAVEYNRESRLWIVDRRLKIFKAFFAGLKVGVRILKNDLGETITGVWLFEEICRLSEMKGWRIFVLGGWGDVNLRATKMLTKRFPKLKLASDAGESVVGKVEGENVRVLEKINKHKPDILFVQYRPIQQEKWIDNNRKLLKAKVAVGIGGTLDEFVGDLKQAPNWMQSLGLKWLWRLFIQPKRWRRMVDAVIVFPWLVFKESVAKKRPT